MLSGGSREFYWNTILEFCHSKFIACHFMLNFHNDQTIMSPEVFLKKTIDVFRIEILAACQPEVTLFLNSQIQT